MTQASPPSKRERTKQANREAILTGARRVFSDIGFGAASVRDIVRSTGLATGTFYNYFPDKEAVFRAVVGDTATQIRAAVQTARRGSRTLEDFVAGGYRAYFEYLVSDPTTFELTRRNSGTLRHLFDQAALGAGTDELEADLRDAIAAGFVPDHDAHLMAAAMVGAGFEIAVRMLETDPPDVDGAVAFATNLFLGGLERLHG